MYAEVCKHKSFLGFNVGTRKAKSEINASFSLIFFTFISFIKPFHLRRATLKVHELIV